MNIDEILQRCAQITLDTDINLNTNSSFYELMQERKKIVTEFHKYFTELSHMKYVMDSIDSISYKAAINLHLLYEHCVEVYNIAQSIETYHWEDEYCIDFSFYIKNRTRAKRYRKIVHICVQNLNEHMKKYMDTIHLQ